jgi:molybdopterin-binding protein
MRLDVDGGKTMTLVMAREIAGYLELVEGAEPIAGLRAANAILAVD